MSALKTLREIVTYDTHRQLIQRATTPKAIIQSGSNAQASVMYQLPPRVGKNNVQLFRHWAEHSEWVRAAINIRKGQVSQSEWAIGPADPDKPYSKRMAQRLDAMFRTPNPKDGDFRTFIEQVIEDLLVLDAGCIEKVPSLIGEPVEIWPVDGGTVKVDRFWDGDDESPRYFWYPDHQQRASWLNSEFIYLMTNPRTYTPVGLSPLETLKVAVDAELSGMNYNRRQVEKAAPDGMMDLGEGIRPEQVDQFKAYWHAEVAGQGAMAFIGGSKNPKFIPFKGSNRDMQFLEWQIYLTRKIAAVFMLTPQDLGVTFDVNRSSSEVQQENTEDRGLRPLLGLVASSLTREVVWDDAFGGRDNNLAFNFTRLNLKETVARAEINKLALASLPWKSINEARREDGREPFADKIYDELMANTPRGIVVLSDIPTAREVIQADKSKGADGGDGSSSGAPAAAKSEPAVLVMED